mmetsp:Transcript_51728/g.125364  ORF Transcript_51728/g.125364 Transcript_51728/m.125364 type:complete len:619 (-) Transcript_51728:64-1920(-)
MIYEVIEEVPSGEVAISVYSSGDVYYSAPRVSTIRCKMDLNAFPYDVQKCDFTIGSMTYDGSLVDVLPRAVDGEEWFIENEGQPPQMKAGIDLLQYKTNTEFSLRRVRITSRNNKYSCCVHPYPVVVYELIIERQTTTFITGIMIPIIVVTLVGFAVLLTPSPLSGARPGISVSVMFTTSAIYLVAARKMPDIGRLTLVGRLYITSLMSSLMMIFISIITTSINLNVAEENAHRADLLGMFRHYDSDKSGTLDESEAEKALNALGLSKSDRLDLLRACHISWDRGITVDEWLVLGEAARQLRPSTQGNIIIGALLRWLRMRQRNSPGFQEPELEASARGTSHPHESGSSKVSVVLPDVVDVIGDRTTPDVEIKRSAYGIYGELYQGADVLYRLDASITKVEDWVSKLGYSPEVSRRFLHECIDVHALANLTNDQVGSFGVDKVGHQVNLIAAAKRDVQKELAVGSVVAEEDKQGSVQRRGDNLHVINIVEPSSPSASKDKSERFRARSKRGSIFSRIAETAKTKKTFLKHLGAWIDFWSIIIFPSMFIIYLCVEFSGAIIGGPLNWTPVPSDKVATVIELVDERAGDVNERICFVNYQELGDGEPPKEICSFPDFLEK